MRILFILFIFLFSSYTNLANSKTKSEDDALRSLCNIGKNADGKIYEKTCSHGTLKNRISKLAKIGVIS